MINLSKMIERIYIKEAAAKIGCKYRTFKKWCAEFGIEILADAGFKNRYILKKEFEKAADLEPHKYILRKYKCSPQEFNSRINIEAEVQTITEERNKRDKTTSTYQPTQHEKLIIARLHSELGEL